MFLVTLQLVCLVRQIVRSSVNAIAVQRGKKIWEVEVEIFTFESTPVEMAQS